MTLPLRRHFWIWALAAALLGLALAACGKRDPYSPALFVGKWKSSKLETPLVLYENGEWEIRKDDGGVLQYGLWEYRDGRLVWIIKMGGELHRDVNPVLSANKKEFRLQEGPHVTVFHRLD